MAIIESYNVLDVLEKLNELSYWRKWSITEETWGFCCDTGNYSSAFEGEHNLTVVYWMLVNFANTDINEPNYLFQIEYSERGLGNYMAFDQTAPVIVSILDMAGGESSNRRFTIEPA